MKEKYILIKTNGYDIEVFDCKTFEEANSKMKEQYESLHPEENEESCEEMSYINENDAMLYANCESVYVWHIHKVTF